MGGSGSLFTVLCWQLAVLHNVFARRQIRIFHNRHLFYVRRSIKSNVGLPEKSFTFDRWEQKRPIGVLGDWPVLSDELDKSDVC